MKLTRFGFVVVTKSKMLLHRGHVTTLTNCDNEFSNRNLRKYLWSVAVDGFVVDHESQLMPAKLKSQPMITFDIFDLGS